MATLTADKAQPTAPGRFVHAGVFVEHCQFTGAAAFSASDVVQLCKVFPGYKVVNVALATNTLSSGNTTLSIGDGLDVDRYASAAAATHQIVGFTGGSQTIGYEYTADDTVDVTLRAGLANATSAPIIRAMITMAVDNGQSN